MRGRSADGRLLLLALLLLAACGDGGRQGNEASIPPNSIAEGQDLLPGPEEIEAIPNEAAADEAADMQLYGGNAAAGETANGQ